MPEKLLTFLVRNKKVNNTYFITIRLQQDHLRPWSTKECNQPAMWTTNRLCGQRTGDFSSRLALRSFQEDRPIPARPYPKLRTRKVVWSGIISVSPRTREVLRHPPTYDQSPKELNCPACIPCTTTIPDPKKFTIATTNHAHALIVTNSPVFHVQL